MTAEVEVSRASAFAAAEAAKAAAPAAAAAVTEGEAASTARDKAVAPSPLIRSGIYINIVMDDDDEEDAIVSSRALRPRISGGSNFFDTNLHAIPTTFGT